MCVQNGLRPMLTLMPDHGTRDVTYVIYKKNDKISFTV